MNQQLWPLAAFILYFAIFVAAVFSSGVWIAKRRKEKPPLEFKLLRGPGESLRRRMNQFNEDALPQMFAAAMAPVLTAFAMIILLAWASPQLRLLPGLLVVGSVTVPVLFLAGRWALRKFLRYRNDRLGYLGERAVGEALAPLTASGYRVFHDLPAEAGGKKFNVDHVVVGPTGLFAIETKTRRKGRARAGFEAHKVAYDGHQLIWPWAEDSFGLQNAEARARWLSEWLCKMTGLKLAAKPVLVLPGWYVVSKGTGPVTVLNHKQLHGSIMRDSREALAPEEINLIARQLEERCRDVED